MTRGTDVFVSYAREDKPFVELLVRRLEKEGLRVYWDGNLQIGSHWLREINAHLESAPAIAVIWSKNSIGSAFVQAEALKGHARGVLVPVMVEPNISLPAPFNGSHCAIICWRGGLTNRVGFNYLSTFAVSWTGQTSKAFAYRAIT